jgi:uncharacterized alkaline shock family protein YloU
MTTATVATRDPHPAAADSPGQGTGSGTERDLPGRTTLADRVVERTAARALTEIADVGGAAHRVLGDTFSGSPEERSAQVSATVDGTTAALHVRLSIAYPASVAHTTREVRSHLVRRLPELTGLVVTRVDITVTALYVSQPGAGRVR